MDGMGNVIIFSAFGIRKYGLASKVGWKKMVRSHFTTYDREDKVKVNSLRRALSSNKFRKHPSTF